jgi:trans-2,3-dihydro-3-hydroxyanthranilate isomerase
MTFYFLDVFGNSRYAGNQLAVFLDSGKLPEAEMQKIAREINFSETTFITSGDKTNDGYPVRIFTPGSEVDFAGHPTLGTAYVLHHYVDHRSSDTIRLNLKAGQIPVTVKGNEWWMQQNQPRFAEITDIEMMSEIIGLNKDDFEERLPIQEVSTGLPFFIVPLRSMDALRRARIRHDKYWDFVKNRRAKGILVFCPEGYEPKHDLSSRVFVDYYGIPEDPATGSATGCLAAWLVKYGMFGGGLLDLTVGQGYEIGRPSELKIKAKRAGDAFDIHVGGKVFEVASGEWNIT